MIGRLRGTLAEKQPPHLILDVNGIGYETGFTDPQEESFAAKVLATQPVAFWR